MCGFLQPQNLHAFVVWCIHAGETFNFLTSKNHNGTRNEFNRFVYWK